MTRSTPTHEETAGTASSRVPIEEILTRATRAPSVQNTQPWAWRWDGEELLLRTDPSRRLWRADPTGRDMVISCGAVLHHVAVAAAGLGWRATVHRNPGGSLAGRPLAVVTFTPASAVTPEGRSLLRALEERQTDRRPLSAWTVPASRMDELAAEGRAWGALVQVVHGEGTRAGLAAITAAADEVQKEDRYYRREESMLGGGGDADGAGLRPAPRVDPHHDQLLVFSTASDDVLSWLRTGEALSAVWLRAVRDGFTLVPLTQSLEVHSTRVLFEDGVLDNRSCPQLLARVGWPPEGRQPLPRTPRRPLSDVLMQQPG